MNKYLSQKIYKMRQEIESSDEGAPYVSVVKVCGKVYQLLFLSCGCNNACTFCNYGFDFNLTKEMVMPELEKIRLEDYDFDILELEANGSFLSEREIPYDLFIAVLEYIKDKNIKEIAIETHYKTVSEEKVKLIRSILGEKQDISFEFGFESSSEKTRKIYNKDIDNSEFVKTAEMCRKYGISIDVNVLLGTPFYSREEQIQDVLNTLDFIFNTMPVGTRCIIFPVNIKVKTMFDEWRKRGLYKQISSWEFVELLHRIPEKYLDRISIAWWGTRKNEFTDSSEIIHPITCEKCNDRLMQFYESFYLSRDVKNKKKLIEDVWKTRCQCDFI